jgi:hypothetical protein
MATDSNIEGRATLGQFKTILVNRLHLLRNESRELIEAIKNENSTLALKIIQRGEICTMLEQVNHSLALHLAC